jgi:hypothetical protein
MLFGFEADTLEIALRDQLDLVDWFFIVESTVTHKGVRLCLVTSKMPLQMSKPLMWERLKFTPRFSFADLNKVGPI